MIKYLDIVEVYLIHERMIKIGGGRSGIRDFALVHSAVERPKATFGGQSLYPDIWHQGAALIQSLIKNHPFNDGNKRTGFFSLMRFLEINGYQIKACRKEIIRFVLEIDIKKLSIRSTCFWIKKHAIKIY